MSRRLVGASKRTLPQQGRLDRLLESVDLVEADLAPFAGEGWRPLQVRLTAEEVERMARTSTFFGARPHQLARLFLLDGLRQHADRIQAAIDLEYDGLS